MENKQYALYVGDAKVTFNITSPYVAPFDPNHALWAQTCKVFGGFDDSLGKKRRLTSTSMSSTVTAPRCVITIESGAPPE